MTLARFGTMVLVLALAGCDDAYSWDRDGSGVFDGATEPDAGGPALADERGAACYDGLDNDGNGQADCADVGCAANAECCVGSGDAACCDPVGATRSLPLDRCTGTGPALSCLGDDASLHLFGSELPVIESGAFVPQGGIAEGGVVLGDAIDPRGLDVTFDATIAAPANRCTDCVDGAGIAILDRLPMPGEHAVVLFGVIVTGSRDEVMVLVADEPVARAPLVEGEGAYRLELDVSGRGRATRNGALLAGIDGIALPSSARLAVFGRTQNRPAGVAAVSVISASATTRACDAPAAIVRRSSVIVPWSGTTWSPREVRRPSVVAWSDAGTDKALMAFASEGTIYLAQRTGAGEFRSAASDPGPPAFELPSELASARDPWLVLEDTRFLLYFVGVDATGATSVWRTTGSPGYQTIFGAPARVLEPSLFDLASVDAPAITIGDPSWALIARVGTGQDQRLVRFVSADGESWTLRGGSVESATLRVPRTDDLFAFDRDEVGAPASVIVPDWSGRPIERVYYAGRRGTRWSIGLLVSATGDDFRAMGAVLEPGQGFDALGVADPAPLLEGSTLRLYYAGTDGSTWRIGVAGPAGTLGE